MSKNISFFIGHRGTRKDHDENTFDAFEVALDFGANYIEFDVRKTKDNELVIFHDSKVDRNTHSKGFLNNYTYAEIASMRFKLTKSQIPTLNEVLKTFRNRIKFIVELKGENLREDVIKTVNSHKLLEDCIISGRNLLDLELIKGNYLESNVCYNITKGKGLNLKKFVKRGMERSLHFIPDFVSLDSKMITQEFIDVCHKNSIFALSWNFIGYKNPIDVIKVLIRKGIDGILFDNYQNIQIIKKWLKTVN
jgi:glycerophosphoryl diester phosphodiesterase